MSAFTRDASIFVAGHRGLVGSAILRRLRREGYRNLLVATREELDLRDQAAVHDWFQDQRPAFVLLAAGTVGGILANTTRPAEFIYDNLMIHATVVHAAHLSRVRKLLYLGSSCIYPREAPQPIPESALLSGPLEATNEYYAVAKIAGIKLCDAYRKQYGANFISAMPTNLYGPGDNFEPEQTHVIPALMRRFHEAKLRGDLSVTVWGSGRPRREFLHADDLADACLFLMKHYDGGSAVNIGSGEELSIRSLAAILADVIHPRAELEFDREKPDGTPRKLLDSSLIREMGWQPRIALREGIESTYSWFKERYPACDGDLARGAAQRTDSSSPAAP